MGCWEIKRKFRFFSMPRLDCAKRVIPGLLLLFCTVLADGQPPAVRAPVILTVVDENGLAVSGAQVTVLEPGLTAVRLWTDYAGHCAYIPRQDAPYRIRVEKPGFYQTV